jgi:tetratricopeptide (TPR) repeat protein/CHAT domain-containing protein
MMLPQRRQSLGNAAGRLLLAALLGTTVGGVAASQEAGPQPLTPEQRQHLKEWADLDARLNALLQQKKTQAAVALFQRKVALDRQLFGDAHEVAAKSLAQLARFHLFLEDFPAARKVHQDVLALRTRAHGADGWRVRDARLALEHVDRLAELDADGRRNLREADQLHRQLFKLLEQGQARQALPLAQHVLDLRQPLLGKTNALYATSLQNLAAAYHEAGEHARALPLFEAVRDLRRQVLTENHPDYAEALDNLAEVHRALGNFQKALPLAEQARDLRKRLLTENHPDYATSLTTLAGISKGLGAYARALALFQQARDLRKRLLTENHPAYAESLNNLATLYRVMGAYDQALTLYEQVRDLRKRRLGENHPLHVQCLYNLATVYQDLGDYEEALRLYEQARALRPHLRTENPLAYATSLHNLAGLHHAMGAYDKAQPLYERARDLRRQLLPDGHPDYASTLTGLAGLYRAQGAYDKALPHYEQARDLTGKPLSENHLICLSGLAGLYMDLGAFDKALPLYEQARDLTRKLLTENHPHYATCLDNLAVLHQAMGAHEKALPLCKQALLLRKKLLTENHPAYALSLNNAAGLFRAAGASDEALALCEEARALLRKRLTENHPNYATSLNNLAALYQARGAYDQALPLLEQARDLRKQLLTEKHPAYASSLNNLAALYQALGNHDKALSLSEQSLVLRQAVLNSTFSLRHDRGRLESFHRTAWYLHHYATLAALRGSLDERLYRHVLGWKGLVTSRQSEARLAHDQPALRPLLQELEEARAGLARLLHAVPTTREGLARWRKDFDRLEADKERLEENLARQSAAYRDLRRLQQATAADVVKALAPGTALVDFFQYEHSLPPTRDRRQWSLQPRLLAFILTPGRDLVCVPLGPTDAIARAVGPWRQAVTSYRSPEQTGRELARLVWEPLRKHLAGLHTVLIAPDGVLCGLPFAALPGQKPGSFLRDDQLAVGYVTSGRHLLELDRDAASPFGRGLLAVGDLDFGPPDKAAPALPTFAPRQWQPLPGTRPEVEQIVGAFRQACPGQADLFLHGKEAGAAALKGKLPPAPGAPRWRYLHLATHGYFEPPLTQPKGALAVVGPADDLLQFGAERESRTLVRNPLLRSRLVLSRANQDTNGGFLTALEVSGLDLRGVELAVLSACDTGLGRVENNEGVQSLQRGFQMAGARTLVASLWSVHDAATSVLMEEFYANLWQHKMTKLKALTEAQRTVSRNPNRVLQRQKELRALLLKRGVPEDMLAERSLGKQAGELPGGGRIEPGGQSPVAWWAAFVLSGDPR